VRGLLVIASLLASGVAQARGGTLALVNISPGGANADFVIDAGATLKSSVGGWATQPSIADFLAGRSSPGTLPTGEVGQNLSRLVNRARDRQASTKDLAELGRLLGVDYLLLLSVGHRGFAARLYSVPRQSYAPSGLEAKTRDLALLRAYLRQQARPADPHPAASGGKWSWRRNWKRYVIFGAAVAVASVTLGFALSQRNEASGDLRIRVSR
jgi:hypothetical protein